MKKVGIYIHTPFCHSKCGYCDFYSVPSEERFIDKYAARLCTEIENFGGRSFCGCDSIYFGGGTPTTLGKKNLKMIFESIKYAFKIDTDAEITIEANPGDNLEEFFITARECGVNRISLGLQSGCEEELRLLGRRHNNVEVSLAVNAARNAGIQNISLDLMIGIPSQTFKSLNKSLDFLLALAPSHISVYMLTIEKGTPFYSLYKNGEDLPNEEQTAALYLQTCEVLKREGFDHYEVSNFAKPGYNCKHNLKYWNVDDYIGFGPAAHSAYCGKRFYYSRSIDDFMNETPAIPDGIAGSQQEILMLKLRLSNGISYIEIEELFGEIIAKRIFARARLLESNGLIKTENAIISITDKGFLVSNSIISDFLSLI